MSLGQTIDGMDLLGQASGRPAPVRLPFGLEPRLEIGWGEFRQSLVSSIRAIVSGPVAPRKSLNGLYFRGCWIERRVPWRGVFAAALWHVVFFVAPFPSLSWSPHKNPAFDNVELTWSGPINDLPFVEMPAAKPRPSLRAAPAKPIDKGADAFHPRQRIFTDPVRPTHPRQTLINTAAPNLPPKLLPSLPNIVQLQQMPAPPKPALQISAETLKRLRPRAPRPRSVTSAPLPDVPNFEQRPAEISLAVSRNEPARPKLMLNAGAAPRVAQHAQNGNSVPAPDVGTAQPGAASGSQLTLIALSAAPAPPAPVVQLPQGNLAARISISPEGKGHGAPGGAPSGTLGLPGGSKAGEGSDSSKNSVGVSISGGNPPANNGVSGLGGAHGKISMLSARPIPMRPEPKAGDGRPERTGPPNFAALPPGAKPEQIFATKHVYTLYVNMANLNSATGSWILNFSELHMSPDSPQITSPDVSAPVPIKKVDPKYPPSLIAEHVEGEVVLYAVIRQDGTVDSIQLVRGIDEELDTNAMNALSQWKFRPASRQGVSVDLEAIVHIPFHAPEER